MPDCSKLSVACHALDVPFGIDFSNLVVPGSPYFKTKARRLSVTEFIVHETVTRSVATTVRVLNRRKLGVHFIVGPDGAVTQHGDLVRDRLAHAGRWRNGPSVGIEVVNPYYPKYLKPDLQWSSVIEAPWAHKGRYVLPTPGQAEATVALVRWLTSPEAEGLCIPRCWVGLTDGAMAMGRVPRSRRRNPGIYAHHYFGHADGAWLVLYAWLRIEAGMEPDAAYREATARAVGARRSVALADLIEAGRRAEKE